MEPPLTFLGPTDPISVVQRILGDPIFLGTWETLTGGQVRESFLPTRASIVRFVGSAPPLDAAMAAFGFGVAIFGDKKREIEWGNVDAIKAGGKIAILQRKGQELCNVLVGGRLMVRPAETPDLVFQSWKRTSLL